MAGRAPLYIMIKPPRAQRAELRHCVHAHGLDDHYPPPHFHATIARLGDNSLWPGQRLERLYRSLGGIEAEPFPVAFDRLDGNLLRGCSGLRGANAFQRLLMRRLAACGFALPDQGFWLHLSLAYKGPGRTARIAPIGWQVEEFQLVRSVHGEGHQQLGRWPLRCRQLALSLSHCGLRHG